MVCTRMIRAVLTIARYTFAEAMRNRLFLLTLVGLVCMLGLTEFLGELAVIEADRIQAIVIGAGMRIFAIITVALFVITSVVREFNDKGFDLILSLSLPRAVYYFGKFFGFFMLALIVAISTAVLLLLYSPGLPVLIWLLSLVCELAIIIALSLLCLFTFSNVTVAFVVVIGFYFLSRAMYTIQLISDSPILEFYNFSQQFIRFLTDAIAYLLPGLHEFTRSEWLAYGTDWSDLRTVFLQTFIYLALLSAAGLFDLYRKNL